MFLIYALVVPPGYWWPSINKASNSTLSTCSLKLQQVALHNMPEYCLTLYHHNLLKSY